MILDWPGCRNARDVGGLPTVDGASIRAGALLRSDHHARLTPEAVERVRAAGISRIIDLRWPHERDENPSPFAGDPFYVHLPLLMDPITYDYTDESYGPLLDHNHERVAAAFRAVATAPAGGVVVHCHGGRDRTGIVVALALAAAGVTPEAIADDYALTADAPPATMLNTLAHAKHGYGGVEAYLRTAGVTEAELHAVRERLREPSSVSAIVPEAEVDAALEPPFLSDGVTPAEIDASREPSFLTETRNGYDTFAAEYADRFRDELAQKHWDRALLSAFAEVVRAAPGPVLDVGSGPGVVTAYLRGHGLDVSGVDLSPEMVAIARRDHPGITFTTGSMTSLDRPGGTLAAVVAWYSIIHVPDSDLPSVLAEFRRVLRPGGHLFLAFQVGDEERHLRGLVFRRRRPKQLTDALRVAGFEIRLETVRAPEDYAVLTERSPQAYVLARTLP